MKASINFSLLCLLLSLQNASAFMGFSFGNLLFSLHVCDKIGHGPLGCKLDCSKSFPPGPKHVCQSDCYVESNSACSSYKGVDMSDYFKCMAASTETCNANTDSSTSDSTSASSNEYSTNTSDGSVSSYNGDTSNSNGGSQPIATRVSLLPFFAAATVSTFFLMFYVWRKNVSIRSTGKKYTHRQ